MKISVNILGTSKNQERIKVLQAGAIKSKKHTVVMNFLAEGERPDSLPENWNWIPFDHFRLPDRHVHALIEGIASEIYDFNIFCDDDVMMDLDKFVDLALQTNCDGQACVWTTWPGMKTTPNISHIIRKHAGIFVNDKKIESLWMGFCTSVINKELCKEIKRKPEVLNCLLKISEDISKNDFIPDLQISILGFLLGAKHVDGQHNNGTCWPGFLDSSVLSSHGRLWHIHATGESPLVPSESLINAIKKAPFSNLRDLAQEIYPSLSRGIKAKRYLNLAMSIEFFWRPWRSRCLDIEVNGPKICQKFVMHNDGSVISDTGLFTKWESCDHGFYLIDRIGSKYDFTLTHESGLIGIPPPDKINHGMVFIAKKL